MAEEWGGEGGGVRFESASFGIHIGTDDCCCAAADHAGGGGGGGAPPPIFASIGGGGTAAGEVNSIAPPRPSSQLMVLVLRSAPRLEAPTPLPLHSAPALIAVAPNECTMSYLVLASAFSACLPTGSQTWYL